MKKDKKLTENVKKVLTKIKKRGNIFNGKQKCKSNKGKNDKKL